MSPVNRIVPKTLRNPQRSQNGLFVVKIDVCFDKDKLEKSRIVPRNSRS